MMRRFSKYTLWMCLLALLPFNAHADTLYGISDGYNVATTTEVLHGTWHEAYYDEEGLDRTVDGFTGSGTRVDPYQINNEWDLCRLEDLVNKGNEFNGRYFKLMNDINLTGKIWYPIGVTTLTPFSGRFDGNDHTINRMTIIMEDADNTNYYSYGLFGFMKGMVRHLNMTNAYVAFNRTASNQAQTMMAGILCGQLTGYIPENIFGAVYECNIDGLISGDISNFFDMSYVGGIAAVASNPVSIYKCQTNVRINTTDIRHVGGIVGYSSLPDNIPSGRTNTLDTPCASYIFDCVANVNITAELKASSILYCGGLCGMSEGELLACVSNGTIRCGLDEQDPQYEMNQVSMMLGGLVGTNSYIISNCVSTAHLIGGKYVGGLIGENNKPLSKLTDDVLNCVFCGHIDSPDAVQTHGLIGNQGSNTRSPFNCLFVGTMNGGTNKAPLSNGTTTSCYSDRNMYDDGSEWSCYKYTDQFSSANATWFVNEYQHNVAWESIAAGSPRYKTVSVSFYNWVIKDGFYPYYKVDQYNVANTSVWDDDERLVDYVIAVAARSFDDNETTLRTPSLYEKYAWLASVPMNVQNHSFRANFVDTPFSLAIKQQPLEGNNMKTATFSLSGDLMTVSGETNAQTATPKDNVSGAVMLTITSDDNVSRSICLDVYTRHQWDGKVARNYDGGDGTEGSPYLIHNARQLMKALTTNESGEYYRLTRDIWFNENLLTDEGEPKEGALAWDHQTNRSNNNWKAHLDGDNHLIRGLYSTNAFGLVEKIHNSASIVNVGFVDCLAWSPEADPVQNVSDYAQPFAFLTPVIGATATVSNCLFNGVVKERRTNNNSTNFGAFIHTIDNSQVQIGTTPVIEDCVLSIVGKSELSNRTPENALFCYKTGSNNENCAARRVLLLNNSNAQDFTFPTGITLESCYYPEGYLNNTASDTYSRQVSAMTDGTFFTGSDYDKWTARQDHFPILTSFAATADGKLIDLPIYASTDNRLGSINYLLDFYPGAASWRTSNSSSLDVDKDVRVIEPKQINRTAYVVRTMTGAKMVTPVTTATQVTVGIKFEDPEAEKFCLAKYDDNNDGKISLSELKTVTLDKFQEDMNENDGISYDNDGELIKRFPEFRYFAGVDGLGTSFQDKDKLEMLAFSGNIKALPDDAFKGTTSMSQFTIPVSITTFGAHPFYNSGLENFEVDADHTVFAADGGLLTNRDKTQLLCWPNGKKGFDVEVPTVENPSNAPRMRRVASQEIKGVEIPANVTNIASNAIYKVPDVGAVFLKSPDYNYKTVKELAADAVTKADNVSEICFYVMDATNDVQDNDQTEETGEGNGHLLNLYKASSFWTGKKLDRYWELEVSPRSKDSQGRYWATMYIGFDTQLPEGLTAYTVDKEENVEVQYSKPTIVLRKLGRKVPMMTPVVIMAEKSGTFKLFPSKEAKYEELGMSANLLDGVNRNGFDAYQSDSNDGGCLTLGVNMSGTVGFFIYKGKAKIPAFRAYISVNKVNGAPALELTIPDDESTDIRHQTSDISHQSSPIYDLQGRKIADDQQPTVKGVYIQNGRLIIKK